MIKNSFEEMEEMITTKEKEIIREIKLALNKRLFEAKHISQEMYEKAKILILAN